MDVGVLRVGKAAMTRCTLRSELRRNGMRHRQQQPCHSRRSAASAGDCPVLEPRHWNRANRRNGNAMNSWTPARARVLNKRSAFFLIHEGAAAPPRNPHAVLQQCWHSVCCHCYVIPHRGITAVTDPAVLPDQPDTNVHVVGLKQANAWTFFLIFSRAW